jgi:hypothetical protein
MPMNPRLLRPLATGLNPKSIAGLSAWWDFSDSAQITLNSGNISQILDKSNAGRTASQGTASSQPARITSAQNGLSMARFDGSNDHLTYGTDLFTFTGAATIFVVCKGMVNLNSRYGMFLHEYRANRTSVNVAPGLFDASQRGFRPGIDAYSGQTYDTAANFGSPTQTNAAVVQFYWENWSTHHNDGKTLIGVNNDSESLTSRGSSALTFSTSATLRHIGSGQGAGSLTGVAAIEGDIGEILVWTAALNASQRSAVRRALGRKWGITVT